APEVLKAPAADSRHVATIRSELGGIARDSELLDAAAESAGIKTEDRGGATAAGDYPVGVPENFDDVIALHGLEARQGLARGLLSSSNGDVASLFRPRSFVDGRSLCRRGQKVGRDLQSRAARQDDGALQHILQLADVARPWVRLKVLHRRLADGV